MIAKILKNHPLELMITNQGESGISQVQLVIVGTVCDNMW